MKNRIKELRKLRKMTQQELAKLIGVSQVQVGRLENGERGLDIADLPIIAKALGVEPYELLPKEFLPSEITPEEREILRMIRKSKAADNNTTTAEPKAG